MLEITNKVVDGGIVESVVLRDGKQVTKCAGVAKLPLDRLHQLEVIAFSILSTQPSRLIIFDGREISVSLVITSCFIQMPDNRSLCQAMHDARVALVDEIVRERVSHHAAFQSMANQSLQRTEGVQQALRDDKDRMDAITAPRQNLERPATQGQKKEASSPQELARAHIMKLREKTLF